MTKQSFLRGAFILVMASTIVKALGFLYQIFVIRLIGTEGIGIFNMVFPLYLTAIIISSAGLPLAVSRFIAASVAKNNEAKTHNILYSAMSLLLVSTSIISLILILVSPALLRKLYSDSRVIPAFLVLIVSLLPVSVMSALKGYFQGLQDMRPTAFSQLLEQIIRFISGLTLIYFLYPYGLIWTAVGLALAVLLSEVSGLVYLWYLYQKHSNSRFIWKRPERDLSLQLFSFGVPITITRIILTLTTAIEASMIPHQLINSGYTISQATSFYGELSGVAFTLLTIPSILTFSLAITLVPSISEAQSNNQKATLVQRTSEALSITLLAGLPCAIILFYWGPYLTDILFKSPNAGKLLKELACGSIFLYIAQTSTGILQGIGRVKPIFLTTLTSSIIRISGIYILGGKMIFGMSGIIVCYIASFFTLSTLNLILIRIETGFSIKPGLLIRLLLGGFVLIEIIRLCTPFVKDSLILLLFAVITVVLFFFLVLFITGDKYVRLIFKQIF